MKISKFKKYLLTSDNNLIDAIKKLNVNKYKTIIVVDKLNRLIGTITDGDIRRSLLKGYEKNSNIKKILNKSPKKIFFGKKYTNLKATDAEIIPIIDKSKKIKSILINDKHKKKLNIQNKVTAIIMAGGFGKRLMPLTAKKPKPLIKVGKKPLIDYVFQNLVKYKIKNITISIYYKSLQIKNYFKKKKKLFRIKFLEEKKPLGTAGCLGLLNYKELNENIIVHNSDIITNLNIKNLLKFHIDFNSEITVCAKEYSNTSPFGEIQHKEHKIKKIIEKPTSKNFFNAGIYVIKKKLLKNMPANYLDMTTFIENKIKKGHDVNVYPIYEYWVDVGRKDIIKKLYKKNEKNN